MGKKIISIVTPCYNEKDNIRECCAAIKKLFDEELKDYDFEHIICDNASSDGTIEILREIAEQDKRVKVIINARNFGPMRSHFNGVKNASGDATVLFM
ncbi:MAG: glycosyltransferase, partial [Rhodospirillales bacterium]|nr:glycosyltransferase [Rhodospirillales bacterium]